MSDNINYNFKNLTPFKWFVLENFPFIEQDFDALTNWQLFCKLGKEINKIINSQNSVGEQTENLTNAFIVLKNYVDNYFTNLDVQQEINNKLDEMAETGELQHIIDVYIQFGTTKTYNNVEELKNDNSLIPNMFVRTLGYYTPFDNGNAFYKIVNDNSLISDNGSIINLNNGLFAVLQVFDNTVYIKQFGALGNEIKDDTLAINNAIKYCNNKKYKLFFNTGIYLVTNSLQNLNSDFQIDGSGMYNSIIKLVSDKNINLLNLENQYNIVIKNIQLKTDKYIEKEIYNNYNLQQVAIQNSHSYQTTIENVCIRGFFMGIGNGFYTWLNIFRKCHIYNCTNGIALTGGEGNANSISECVFEYCDQSIRISGGFGNWINHCTLENNNRSIVIASLSQVNISENYFENNNDELEVYSTSEGKPYNVTFEKNYIYITKTTPRILISNTNIVFVKNNIFRNKDEINSSIFGYYTPNNAYSFVDFSDNEFDNSLLSFGTINNLRINNYTGKSIMTASLKSNYTITQNNTQEILNLTEYNSNNGRLTIENNGIKIGQFIKKVKVNINICWYNLQEGTKLIYLLKNGKQITNSLIIDNSRKQQIINSILINVNQGDIISVGVYGSQNDVISGSETFPVSYLTVEEV